MADTGQTAGGRFGSDSPKGVAVYEASGDVYAVDTGNHRVQQFDADGAFIRAWGFDVDLPAASPASSGGFEICTVKASCKQGVASGVAPINGLGGQLSGPAGVAVNQATGDVYVSDAGLNRVQVFTSSGVFVRAFGQDVIQAGKPGDTGTGFEVCVNAADCKAGTTTGATGGVIAGAVNKVGFPTVAPTGAPNAGNVLVANADKRRVEEFSAAGAFVRAFGWDVVAPGGAGASNVNERQVVAVSSALAGGTFTLSLGATGTTTTSLLDFNATAAQVETALGALTAIGGVANVDVSGADGGPWTVDFTGAQADRNIAALTINAGTVPVGTQLSCASTTSAATTTFQWLSNGVPATGAGATTASYTVDATDAGKAVQCRVVKENANAGSTQVSTPVGVATPSGPLPSAPTAAIASPSGTVADGSNLTCAAGTWGGAPSSYTYTWLKNGVQVLETETKTATTDTYTLTAGDVAAPAVFQCLIRGANANGAVSKASQNRATTTAPSPAAPPSNTGSPTVTATAPTGTVTTTQEGSLAFEVCTVASQCQAGVAGAGPGQFDTATPTRIAEGPDGTIYTVEATGTATGAPLVRTSGFRVQKFTLPANVPTAQGTFDCAELCGTIGTVPTSEFRDNPFAVAVDGDGFVYVAKAFLLGTGNPLVEIAPVILSATFGGRKWQERVLKINPAGNGGAGQVVDTIAANTGDEEAVEGDIGRVAISLISGLAPSSLGTPLYLTTTDNRARVYRFDEITDLAVSASAGDVGATAAVLEGTVNPAQTGPPVKTSYHFEYRRQGTSGWVKSSEVDVVVGNGSDGGESDSCSALLQAAVCHVRAEVEGLDLGRTYEYRLVATTSYRGATEVTAPQEFTTVATRPTSTPRGAVWSGPPATNPSLTFNGRVNPQGADTTYSFEYVSEADFDVSGYANARSAPTVPVDAGHGVVGQDVTAVVVGLDASSIYHFRLRATNATGVGDLTDRTVTPPQAGDRFFELVSNGDSQGADLNSGLTISDDGERVMFTAPAFGDDQQGAPWILNPNIAQRGDTGWVVKSMAPDPVLGGGQSQAGVGNAEVTRRLWQATPSQGSAQWGVRNLDGSLTPVSPVISPFQRTGSFGLKFQGGSADLSTIVFSGGSSTLFADEPMVSSGSSGLSNLYEVSGAGTGSPMVRIVNRASDGSVVGGACGASLGAEQNGPKTNAVSPDGSVVYFSARAGTPAGGSCASTFGLRIFKRVGGTSTVEVSACAKTLPATCGASGDDLYLGASADGSKVVFSTTRQLTDSDGDATDDLYLYDSDPPAGQPNLVQVSAGELVAGANLGDPPAHQVGAGALALGVADISMDGSRVYFVAKGRLTAGASEGANNLFVFERDEDEPGGRIGLVATLAAGALASEFAVLGDPNIWALSPGQVTGGKPAYALPRYESDGGARVDGDGHLLVFVSTAALLPAVDSDSFRDLYRYDDETGQLACLSCVGDGEFPVSVYGRNIGERADADQVQQERIASEDGSKIVFTTKEPLLPEDTNLTDDLYLSDDGQLSLISGPTGDSGVEAGQGENAAISPDGRSVFFMTRATLLPEDTDNGALDFYVVRVAGGSPQSEPPLLCDVLAWECQGLGGDPTATDPKTTVSGPSGDAVAGDRVVLSLGVLSRKARARASRAGMLPVRVRTTSAAKLQLSARARIAGKSRLVGRAFEDVSTSGATTVKLRLSAAARRMLRKGQSVMVTVRVISAGARSRSMTVRLPGASS